MKIGKMLWILIPLVIIGIGILIYGLTKEEVPPPTKEIIEENTVKFNEKGELADVIFDGTNFSEKDKLILVETDNETLKQKNEELKKTVGEANIDYTIYHRKDKQKIEEGEVEVDKFLIVYKNNGDKPFTKKMAMPCENYLNVFLEKDLTECTSETTEMEFTIQPKGLLYYVAGQNFGETKGETKVYFQTPIGIKQTTIELE